MAEEQKMLVMELAAIFWMLWVVVVNAERALEENVNGETETLTYFIHGTDEVAIVAGPGQETHDMTALKFGSTLILDNDVTDGPERTSKLVGRREGMATMDNFAGENYYLLFTVIFEHHEKYHGTLQVQGTEIGHGHREISIVGGTGDFRDARGYSTFFLHTAQPYPIIQQTFHIYKTSFNYKPSVDSEDDHDE